MTSGEPTAGGSTGGDVEALWEAHRRRVVQLAVRMLSDLGEAEDVAQEAFGRLARTDLAAIDDPEGWLVVVTSRLCLDRLRTRRRRPADALHLAAEPADERADDPADHVALVDSVTLAMHVVLERLTPAERTAFVLHDVFQMPFDEIGGIVGRSREACRQLASRARRTVRAEAAGRRFPVEDDMQRRIGERFVAACTDGDLAGLLALLDPDVDGTGDGGRVAMGADVVAPATLGFLGPPASPLLLRIPIDDRVGIVAVREERVLALVVLTIGDGVVTHVDALAGAATRTAVGRVLGLPTR